MRFLPRGPIEEIQRAYVQSGHEAALAMNKDLDRLKEAFMDPRLKKNSITPEFFMANFRDMQDHIANIPSSYPKDYQRVDQKTEHVIKNLELFSGSVVIDIGSNFGMFSLFCAGFAKEVHGIERERDIYEISEEIKRFFQKKGFYLDNLKFYNKTLEFIRNLNYDSILACLILYHLNDTEIDILIEDAKKKCDKIILQCRPGRANWFAKGRLTDHVSVNSKFNGLYDVADNIRFLHAIGFKNILVDTNPKLFGDEVFPVVMGYN